MAYDLKDFKNKLHEVLEWLGREFSGIRTGQATVTLLDSVRIEMYGAKSPLNQVATITVEDPKTIRIAPWDKSIVQSIEKAITLADLGVSTAVDSEGVRVIFPNLTTETRERLVKQAKNKAEEAKVSVRGERSKVIGDIDSVKKAGEMSEDDAKREKDNVQKLVDETNSSIDEKMRNKEVEIMN